MECCDDGEAMGEQPGSSVEAMELWSLALSEQAVFRMGNPQIPSFFKAHHMTYIIPATLCRTTSTGELRERMITKPWGWERKTWKSS